VCSRFAFLKIRGHFFYLCSKIVTMAEETSTTTEPVAADVPAIEGEAAKVEEKETKNGKRPFKREDLVPIEELFDLSKPIPRVSFFLVSPPRVRTVRTVD
jgi:hypothetical protein